MLIEESFGDRMTKLTKLIETDPESVLRVLDALVTKEGYGNSLLDISLRYVKERDIEDKESLTAIQDLLKEGTYEVFNIAKDKINKHKSFG